jgi:hypothetical protein
MGWAAVSELLEKELGDKQVFDKNDMMFVEHATRTRAITRQYQKLRAESTASKLSELDRDWNAKTVGQVLSRMRAGAASNAVSSVTHKVLHRMAKYKEACIAIAGIWNAVKNTGVAPRKWADEIGVPIYKKEIHRSQMGGGQ